MRRLVLLVCGCNQVFGLRDTRVVDAAYFDAPVDAPFACPPSGTALHVSPIVHQLDVLLCKDFIVAGDRAAGWCADLDAGAPQIFEGPREGPLAVAAGIGAGYSQPRLSPDGSELLVYYATTMGVGLALFDRGSDGTWTLDPDPTIPIIAGDRIGTMARGPTGDRVIIRSNDGLGHEWEHEGHAWNEIRTHSSSDLGVGSFLQLNMTPDGLHAIVQGSGPLYVVDRTAPGQPFHAAAPIDGLAELGDVVMTDDCGRFYFEALNTAFYAQQD